MINFRSLGRYVTRATAAAVSGVAVAAVIVAAVVAGNAHDAAGTPSADHPQRTVTVSLDLMDFDANYAGCDTSGGGYSDVSAGAQVSIVDRSGAVLATGTFGEPSEVGDDTCTFTAEVSGVNAYLPAYGATFGNQNRGTINDTRDELVTNGWTFDLTLGDG